MRSCILDPLFFLKTILLMAASTGELEDEDESSPDELDDDYLSESWEDSDSAS